MAVEFQVKPIAGKLNIAYPAEHCEKLRSEAKTDTYEPAYKKVKFVFTLLLSILISIGFIACSDDSDKEEKNKSADGDQTESDTDETDDFGPTAGVAAYDLSNSFKSEITKKPVS